MKKINKQLFKQRRDQIAEKLKGAALIVVAHPEMIRNHDVHHAYRPDTNMHYLTGFPEAESVFVFRPGCKPETVMFVRPKNVERETWDGFRYGPAGTEKEFAIDKGYSIEEVAKELPLLLKDVDQVYYRLRKNEAADELILTAIDNCRKQQGRTGKGLLPILDADELLGEARLFKSPIEIEMQKEACEISAIAHIAAMKATKPGISERQLHGILMFEFMNKGSDREGYTSIVASGSNATTLHYVLNDDVCKDGDLILIDAGAEKNMYTGDITRTYPVSGKFSDAQTEVYQMILDVQKEIIKIIKPGLVFKQLQERTIELLTEGMLRLGILHGRKEDIITGLHYRKYYPHGVSHFLGMDVHDAGKYLVGNESRKLEPGMSFTVEPGLYFPIDDQDCPAKFRGIGIRIEDDVVVTQTGCEVLTATAPKEISDLEKIIGTNWSGKI